jgi:RpiB/LacA/LacB family sugar-phosphate isomerase
MWLHYQRHAETVFSCAIGSHVATAGKGHLPVGVIVRIGFGSDEAGVESKERLKARFCGIGHAIDDVSKWDPHSGDYQGIADQLATAIYAGRVERGVLICFRAIGASMMANKQPGVRAALCHDPNSVRRGVQDDDMNLLVMEAGAVTHELAFDLVNVFIHTSYVPRRRTFGIPPRYFARVIEHIRKNLDKPLAVSLLSRIAEMSQSHFSKLFKLSTGLTPHQFVLQERINRAKVLLRQRNARIVDIALGVGFENQAHFTTVFGNFVGMTPRQFQCSSDCEPCRTSAPPLETPRYW